MPEEREEPLEYKLPDGTMPPMSFVLRGIGQVNAEGNDSMETRDSRREDKEL